MNLPEKNNKDVVVSFIYAMAREPNMSVNEKRVILRIIEFAQNQIRGIRLRNNLRKIEHGLWQKKLSMPISDAFFSDYKRSAVKDTLLKLRNRTFEFCIKDKEKKLEEWWACGYIEQPEVKFGKGMMSFLVDNRLWDVLLNLSSGVRIFELEKALNLPTVRAIDMYILISGQKTPWNWTIPQLKERLGIDPKAYKDKKGKDRTDNLEKVLTDLQDDLKDCPYTFKYEKIRVNQDYIRSPIKYFKIIPIHQIDKRDSDIERRKIQAKLSPELLITPENLIYLRSKCKFTEKGIASNKDTLIEAQKLFPNLISVIEDIKKNTNSSTKSLPAYIIGALKNKIKEISEKKSQATMTISIDKYVTPSSKEIPILPNENYSLWQKLVEEYDGSLKSVLESAVFLGMHSGKFRIQVTEEQKEVLNKNIDETQKIHRLGRRYLGYEMDSHRPSIEY